MSLKLNVAGEGLAKPPSGRNNIESRTGLSVGGLKPKGQGLAIEIGKALPVGTPVS